jgi:hypothetical protein
VNAPVPSPPPLGAEEQRAREEERRSRLAKHPYLQKSSQVTQRLEKAKALLAKDAFSEALLELNALQKLEPRLKEVNELIGEARRRWEAKRKDG